MLLRQLSGVCERDIDLLLLEEFVASPGFLHWFLCRVGLRYDGKLLAAERSVTAAKGESDLELTLELESRVVKLLIENKIDAAFQPAQPERYRERADDYVRSQSCHAVRTVILGPERYFENETAQFGFDERVTYESLLDWFQEANELGGRALYKCALLRAAIERGQVGWRPIRDETVTSFWQSYWQLADSFAPELRMPMPRVKPRASSFIYFHPIALSQGVSLVHKLTFGQVDLQLSGQAPEIGRLHTLLSGNLGPRMRLERAGKSAAVRISVPPIDISLPFTEPPAREALAAAGELLRWYTTVLRRSIAPD